MDRQGRALFLVTLSAVLTLTLLSGVPGCAGSSESASVGPPRWFKGNTHTHSLWSDGDAAPEHIADWYKSHGYQFLVLSDHNIVLEGEKWRKFGTGKGEVPADHVAALVKKFGESAVETREKAGAKEMKLKTFVELRKQFEETDRFLFIHGE